ncbi:glycosyltransferase [Terriglobus sp.]|uniref:glycosyltransferase n=1 Tax=Terriglobus sp. TaxID=1889013 RepID=UPI003AFF85F1
MVLAPKGNAGHFVLPEFDPAVVSNEPSGERSRRVWHVLQLSDVLDLELATALAERRDVVLWQPKRRLLPIPLHSRAPDRSVAGSHLRIRQFPLLRGFARLPPAAISWVSRWLAAELARGCDAEHSVLVCTIPHFAAVAEAWPGPVVYWLTDRIAAYANADAERIAGWDKRMCSAADLVCPSSVRIAEYLQEQGCDPAKIEVLPNATRACNLLPAPLKAPARLPEDIAHLPRPIAGVIGNLAGNMDWELIEAAIEQSKPFTWLFVGSNNMHIADAPARAARQRVMQHPRTCFTGPRLYGDLMHYARAVDVAVLPYRRCEPTFSGSSTRFYEHLAATRPMLATPGVHELLGKAPLVKLVTTPQQMAEAMQALQAGGFDDGCGGLRWQGSQLATWSRRAAQMSAALAMRAPDAVLNREALAPEQEPAGTPV